MNADQFKREFGAIEEEVEAMSKKLQRDYNQANFPNPSVRIQFADEEAWVSAQMLKGLLLLGIMFAVGFAVGWMVR